MSGEHTLKAVRGSFIDVTRTVDNPEEIASAGEDGGCEISCRPETEK